jgi:hypothetical protein
MGFINDQYLLCLFLYDWYSVLCLTFAIDLEFAFEVYSNQLRLAFALKNYLIIELLSDDKMRSCFIDLTLG